MIDANGAAAAIRAGHSTNSARQIASETLSKPYIKEEIDKRKAKLAQELRDRMPVAATIYNRFLL